MPPASGPSGVSIAAREAGDDRVEVAELDPAPRLRRGDLRDELGVEVGRGEVHRLEDAVHERPHLGPDRHLGEQRRHRTQRVAPIVVDRRGVRPGLVVDERPPPARSPRAARRSRR